MVDKVFSHRLGLVPLNVDPTLLEMKESPHDQATDRNMIVFKLQIECTRNTAAPRDSTDVTVLYNNTEVLAGHVTDLQGPPSERMPEEKLWDFKTRAQQYARDRESCDDVRISYLEFLETEAEDDLALARMIAG
jgi:hypothetical protein